MSSQEHPLGISFGVGCVCGLEVWLASPSTHSRWHLARNRKPLSKEAWCCAFCTDESGELAELLPRDHRLGEEVRVHLAQVLDLRGAVVGDWGPCW